MKHKKECITYKDFESGKSDEQLSKEKSCTRSWVRKIRKRWELENLLQGPVKHSLNGKVCEKVSDDDICNLTVLQIIEKYKISARSVTRIRSEWRKKHNWTILPLASFVSSIYPDNNKIHNDSKAVLSILGQDLLLHSDAELMESKRISFEEVIEKRLLWLKSLSKAELFRAIKISETLFK